MKMKTLGFCLCLFVSASLCRAQSNIWTGGANTSNWDTPGNWSLGTVPGPTSSVSIKYLSGKFYPVLTRNVEIGYLDMYNKGAGGSLYLGGYELKTGTVWVAFSNIYSTGGTIRTSMVRLCGGMNFYGNLTLYTDNGVIGGFGGPNTFHGDLTVYANPHVPAGQTTGQCWPCGGLMFSYLYGDTFKGNFKLTDRSAVSAGGVSYIGFGVFPMNIIFEKKAAFIDSSANGLSMGFAQYGGNVTFMDSVLFSVNSSYVALRGNVEFQKPVTFRQTGGNIEVTHWSNRSNNDAATPSLATFRQDLLIDKTGGSLRLGSGSGGVANGSVIDPGGSIRPTGGGFSGGKLAITNTVINSPNQEILATTHPASATQQTEIYLRNATVNGALRIKADDVGSANSTFHGRTVLEKGGSADWSSSEGGNTFYKPVEIVNSGGHDWNFGSEYPDLYKDSVRIAMSGTGQLQHPDDPRRAAFRVALASGNRFEGPVRIETGAALSGDVELGTFGGAEFMSTVSIDDFKSGALTFYNGKFRGANLTRNLTANSPGVELLLKDSCLFEGQATIKVPHFSSDFTEFMKPVLIWKTEDGDDESIGGNTYRQRVQFKNSASTGSISLLSGEDKLIEKVPQ